MDRVIVNTSEAITLVAAGPLRPEELRLALAHAPVVVALDGGADEAVRHGVLPVATIGDFDSISPETCEKLGQDRLFPIAEQVTTDFDKALRSVRAPLILVVGAMGGRADHALAVLSGLLRHQAAGGAPCVLIGPEDVVFAAPPALCLHLPVGERVSLFPLAEVTGQSTGLRWPIDGLVLAPWGRIGTSNETSAPEVALRFDRPGMLAILPRRNLSAVLAALTG